MTRVKRSPVLVKRVIEKRGARCQVCGWFGPVHVHHVVPVSEGGKDSERNVLVLCPNHHAIAHRLRVDPGYNPSPWLDLSRREGLLDVLFIKGKIVATLEPRRRGEEEARGILHDAGRATAGEGKRRACPRCKREGWVFCDVTAPAYPALDRGRPYFAIVWDGESRSPMTTKDRPSDVDLSLTDTHLADPGMGCGYCVDTKAMTQIHGACHVD